MRQSVLALGFLLFICQPVKATEDLLARMCATYGSLATCLPIPANTFITTNATMAINPATDPSKNQQWYVTAWDKSYYVPGIEAICDQGSYRTSSSEPNQGFMCHLLLENRLALWGYIPSWHNEEYIEPGHPTGMVNIDPTSSTSIGQYGFSCAQISDCVKLGNARFDYVGQVGRRTEPGLSGDATNGMGALTFGNQLGSAAFDPVSHILAGLGGSTASQPFWTLDRDTNVLNTQATTSGTVLASSTADQAFTWSSGDGKIYVFGGDTAGIVISDTYRFTASTGAWEKPTITGGPPSARGRSAFAYDGNRNKLYMFGGCTNINFSGCTVANGLLNDFWVLDPVALTWTQSTTNCTPTATALCSNGAPSFHVGTPANENLVWIPENDLLWFFTNQSTAGSQEAPQFWVYRPVPGPPIGYLSKAYNYSVSTTYAAGQTTGTLNHFTQPASGSTANQSWAAPGAITTDGSGKLYFSWTETSVVDTYQPGSVGPYMHVYVDSWDVTNGLKNVPVGATSFSIYSSDAATGLDQNWDPSLTVVSGQPWVGYQSTNPGQASFVNGAVYNGASWTSSQVAKTPTYSAASNDGAPYIINVGGVPTMAYRHRDKPNTFGGTSLVPTLGIVVQNIGGNWNTTVGPPLNSASVIDSLAITSDGTMSNLYAAYTQWGASGATNAVLLGTPQVFLKKWNPGASTWDTQCGGIGNRLGSGKAFDIDATYLSGVPYMVWTERTGNVNTPQVIVAKCSGGSWSTVAADLRRSGTVTEAGGLSNAFGWPLRPRITNDGANLFVTWVEQNNPQPWISQTSVQTSFGQRGHVFVAQVTPGGAVTYLGGTLNIDPKNGTAKHPSIAMLSAGTPVVFFGEYNAGNMEQIYIKQWNGLDWVGLTPPTFAIITGSPLPNATNTVAYSQNIQTTNATGNLTSCTVGSGFPAWATLGTSGTNCTITGVPNLIANNTFTITATDSGSHSDNRQYQLRVVSNINISTSSPLPSGTVGAPYSTTIQTTGGANLSSCVSVPALPAWATLTLSGVNCILSGTPNLIASPLSFTINVQDTSGATDSQPYQLTISSNCAISTASPLNSGTTGSAFTQTLATTFCLAPLTWSVSAGLDPGLSLGASSGAFTGTPVGPVGTDSFTVTAADAAGAAPQKAFTQVIVSGCVSPSITTTSPLTGGVVGTPYNKQFVATGDVGGTCTGCTWSATSVPSPLSLSSSGLLSGTPSGAAVSTIQVTATNACGSNGPLPFSLTVTNPVSNKGTGTVHRGKTAIINQSAQ